MIFIPARSVFNFILILSEFYVASARPHITLKSLYLRLLLRSFSSHHDNWLYCRKPAKKCVVEAVASPAIGVVNYWQKTYNFVRIASSVAHLSRASKLTNNL